MDGIILAERISVSEDSSGVSKIGVRTDIVNQRTVVFVYFQAIISVVGRIRMVEDHPFVLDLLTVLLV